MTYGMFMLGLHFAHRVTSQRTIMRRWFDEMLVASSEQARLSEIAKKWATAEALYEFVGTIEMSETESGISVNRAIAEDSAFAIILTAYTSLERSRSHGFPDILEAGDEVYGGVKFAQAIWTLADAYRHFGEWTKQRRGPRGVNADVFVALGLDPLNTNAALVFLQRLCAGDYTVFEERWLSLVSVIMKRQDWSGNNNDR